MTQAEFRAWLERVLGETPMDELISPEILQHVNRIELDTEQRAWQFAQQNLRESFEAAFRAMMKTMFAVGYDAGREQGNVDRLFGEGSGLEDEDSGGDTPAARGDEPRLPL